MSGTLTYQKIFTLTNGELTFPIQGVQFELTVGDAYHSGQSLVTFAAPLTLAVGDVADPLLVHIRNMDDTNFVTLYDDAAVLAVIPALQSCTITLESGVVLKAQADTADVLCNYAVFDRP